jgi:hypothetical protein
MPLSSRVRNLLERSGKRELNAISRPRSLLAYAPQPDVFQAG